MSISINNLSKTFGQFQALTPLSLDIHDGEMIGLLGPSGSGKTTLLRIIAGLETANTGTIHFGGRDVTHLHVRERRVGFVFQNYALFRHMTIEENVAFGLRVMDKKERPSNQEIQKRVKDLLDIVQLGHLAKRYPEQLSGGQKQRISLARALATKPEVLLLDEPFGALDSKVRKELRRWLRSLHDELGFTSVFVTHDQDEAMELSDRVVVMSNGCIEQVDTPARLYEQPNSRFVFDFLGNVNVFNAQWDGAQHWSNGQAFITPHQESQFQHNGLLYVRSHEISLANKENKQASLPAKVMSVTPIGAEVRVELAPQGWESDQYWEVRLSHRQFDSDKIRRGGILYLVPQAGYFFAQDTHQDPLKLAWPFLEKDAVMFEI
ncbi:sulfate/molybdate ABC transporter ATP-binding protein [Vibrio nitrifigilis]|uniref:TOBE-like domain-containing protein n=1 Tax=Vibrio nitrifigilis TaxID=2789781 RepID=A0ABS0GIE3_9VIBR|nr:TOBE-like domain-containing protein [Vibrio nitrifigilis]MBF9002203.1 TOBE-like domain-containing protein [Vibrio nitrifigilis]